MQARPDAFNGVVQCLTATIREEGVAALWKGSVPALVSLEGPACCLPVVGWVGLMTDGSCLRGLMGGR